jgi:paraquat-inducible protein B
MSIDISSPTPDESTPTPLVRRSRGISVIWTLPLLALVICGWLLYQSIQNAGIEITIYFDNANGLTASKTQVMSKGIPVGLVKKLEPDLKQNKVRATVLMDKGLEDHLVADTQFWVVRAELSAASVQGLETIFTGSYIGIRAGTSTQEQREYQGLASAPPVSEEAPGLHITLTADALGSIQRETGIYYKNIEIGKVQDYRIALDSSILIDVHIEPEYTNIVRTESRFSNASGMSISGELTNLKVQIESLSSLLRGGILVHTPKELHNSPPAQNGQTFHLYKDFEDADYGIPMTLQLSSGADIVEGATKIMYRGIEAGFVKEIKINDDDRKTVTAQIQLDPRAEFILRENTVFWLVKPAITPAGVSNIRTLLTGSHITFRPGDGDLTTHFTILPEPPPQEPLRAGAYLQLKSDDGVNLTAGSPVYFKDIPVGEVIHIGLAPGSADVFTTIFIYEPYQQLVHSNSVFWLQSGVEIKADFSGIQVETGPLARLLAGGVVFSSPPMAKNTKTPLLPDHIFHLYENYSSAVAAIPSLQPAGIHFQLQTSEPANISIGTPIVHRNIKIGHVTGLSFGKDRTSVLIDCFIDQENQRILTSSTRFYSLSGVEVSGGLNGINLKLGSVESILKGGIACITDSVSSPVIPKKPLPLYKDIEEALHSGDTEISIRFARVGGLKSGSPVRYKGVNVGKITSISFGNDLQHINVNIRVDDIVAPLFRTTTRIWQVEPEISLSGIQNIETAITGSYLTFLPGAGKPTREFTAVTEAPQTPYSERDGLQLILESTHLGSLTVGSPLYYRELKIGEVTGFELSPSFRQIYIYMMVEPKYAAVVRANTRFWNVSGARVEGGLLSGIVLSAGSLDSMMRGGIALATPNNEEAGQAVAPGQHFHLHDKAAKEWLDWNPDIILLGD